MQDTASPPDPLADDEARRLDLLAWRCQTRDVDQAAAIGEALARRGADARSRGLGWFHLAFARPRSSVPRVDEAAIAGTHAAAAATGDPMLAARSRIVWAEQHRREARHAEALALLEPLLDTDAAELGDEAARYTVGLCLSVASLCCIALGDVDRALRLRYRGVSIAEGLSDTGPLANALANLSGVHADMSNSGDALACGLRAVALADAAGMAGSLPWFTACCNLVIAHLQLDQVDEALAVSRRMQALQAQILAGKRARYEVLWASAAIHAGLLDEAAHWLDAAQQRWADASEVLIEWQLARAMLDNRQGRPADARRVCDQAHAQSLSAGEEVLPVDLWLLCEEGARACEALGDFEAALRYKQLGFSQYELMAGRSARARRVMAEIQHGLDLARLARDEALRRHEAAQAEQRRLAELNQALHRAGEARSRFLAAASHDLRQPLHALTLQTANLAQALAGHPQQAAVAPIRQSAAALAQMFDSLLDLSRIEAGTLAPALAPVPLARLLAALVEEHQAEAERRGLRLALRLPAAGNGAAPAALQVHSDAVLLGSLLRNLIGNALKYTDRGGVLVALRRRQTSPGGRGWQVQVIDTGIGIAEDEQAQVFEAFYQVRHRDRTMARGLGLGLSIVQRLAALLDHPLTLRSVPGRGSIFSLALKAAAAPAVPEQRPDAAAPAPALQPGLRIALAEDDADAREALCVLLRGWGCEVTAADSGDALLHRLAAAPGPWPEVLVTDHHMPGTLDGLGLAQRWRERLGPAAPVLLVSADPALPASAALLDRLPKPVLPERLAAWLAHAQRHTQPPAQAPTRQAAGPAP